MDGDAEEAKKKEPFLELFEIIVLIIILGAVFLRVLHYFTGGAFSTWVSFRPNLTQDWNAIQVWFSEIIVSLTAFINGFCLLVVVIIGYVIFRQREVDKGWRQLFYPPEKMQGVSSLQGPTDFFGTTRGAPPPNLPGAIPAAPEQSQSPRQSYQSPVSSEPNARWQSVLSHIASDSPSNWRLAILEADILLAEVLDKAGYSGDTLGDKLKNAERRPFAGINAAWEAHKVRNAIAHEGQNFELTQREAQRVINLYQVAIADILRIQ